MELRRNLWIKKIILILCFLIVLLWIIINDNSCILGGIKKKITIERINVKTFDNFPSNYRLFDDIKVDEISLDNRTNVLNIITFKKQIDSSSKYKIFHQQNLMPSKKLPSVLIIGVKKGGTRALLEFLRIHPDIRAAGSEVHFFDRHYNKGLYWYRHRMPPTLDGQITMEKTPSYFITQDAPKRVYHMNSKTKLIIVVRDPVTRSISDYTQVKSKRPNLPKFEIRAFINGTNIVDTNWAPLKIGIYSKYLDNWLKYFPLSQLLIVSGERLIADPVIEITRVQDFIGIKRVISEKHFYFNTTKGFPCLMKSEHRAIPHCLGKTKGRSHPHIDPDVIERLRNFYRPFNHRFYQLTGINFGWA